MFINLFLFYALFYFVAQISILVVYYKTHCKYAFENMCLPNAYASDKFLLSLV